MLEQEFITTSQLVILRSALEVLSQMAVGTNVWVDEARKILEVELEEIRKTVIESKT